MLSFSEFLIEVARDKKRAVKLADYIHARQRRPGSKYSSRLRKDQSDQMMNTIPRTNKRPNITYPMMERYFQHVNDKPEHVPIHKIVSGQSTVSKDVVQQKILGKWREHEPEYPWFIHHKGIYYLVDGNHRVNQDRLEGKTHSFGLVYHVADHFDDWHKYLTHDN